MRRIAQFSARHGSARLWLAQLGALALTLAVLSLVQLPLAADTIAEATPPPPPSELTQFRTASSRTFDNHDGTYTSSLYSGRIHYRDEQGAFRPVSSQLVPSREPGYAWENEANSFRTFFRSQLQSNFLKLGLGSRSFMLSLQDAAASSVQTRQRGLSYPEVFPGVELRYDLQPDGVKESLLLANAQVPLTYRFLLSPPPGARVHAVQEDDGSWTFLMAPHARPVFVLEAPWAAEAGAPRSRARHATLTVARQGADFVVELTVDRDWLRDPLRQFPVRVDPTITIQPPFQDASFDFACPTCKGVTADRLSIGTTNTSFPGPIWRSALQFSVADIPAGASVSSAKLKLYFDGTCVAIIGPSCGGTGHQVDALRMTSSWSANSKTSELAFNPTPLASYTLPSGASAQWMEWAMTSTVQDWLAGSGVSNFGLLLKRSAEPPASSGPKSPSRSYAPEPTLGPKLEVTYNGDGAQLLEPETLHANGAELRWIPYAGPGAPPFDYYEVHRSTNPSFTPSTSTRLTKVVGDSTRTSYRDTTAKAGATFTYKVVTNGAESNPRTVTLPAAGEARKILRPDPTAGRETYFTYRSDYTECANRGAAERLKIGTDTSSIFRSLIRFDVSDLPASTTVSEATLSLWHPDTVAQALTVRVHRLTAAWQEGTGTTTCTGDGATWYETTGGADWGTAGGDFDAAVTASLSMPAGQAAGWHAFSLPALVQQWARAEKPNHGLLLKPDDETIIAGKFVDYYAGDFEVAPTLRPKLSLTYSETTSPAVAPTVAVSKPAANELVKGSTVTISAGAWDDRRVDRVEFFVDSNPNPIGTDTSEPFSITWDSSTVLNGSHSLSAKAIDDAGNQSSSTAVGVTVGNSAVPTTSITSPTGGTVTGTVAVTASAADDVAVTKVELYADGFLIGEDISAPYSFSWNTLAPLLPAYDGQHTLMTKAFDGHENVTTSAPVTVTAANAAGTRYLADLASTAVPDEMRYDPAAQTQLRYGFDVTVTNRSTVIWGIGEVGLRYRWFAPDGTVTDGASVSLGAAPILPNGSVTVRLLVPPLALPDGAARAGFTLRFDLYDTPSTTWFTDRGNKPLDYGVETQLRPEEPTLGLEPYFQYSPAELGDREPRQPLDRKLGCPLVAPPIARPRPGDGRAADAQLT